MLLRLVATVDRTALDTQDVEKSVDLWEGSHTAPLQDTEGKCISTSTIRRQTLKPNRTAGIQARLVEIAALFGDKDL